MIYDRHPELQSKWDEALDAIKKYIREQAEEPRKEDSRSAACLNIFLTNPFLTIFRFSSGI